VGKIFKFADGGLVTGPTLGLLGEAGPELIIPLKKLQATITSSPQFKAMKQIAAILPPARNFDPLGRPGEADRMLAARAAREEAAGRAEELRERRMRAEDNKELAHMIVSGLKAAGFGQTINNNIDMRGSFVMDDRTTQKITEKIEDYQRGRRRYGRGRG